MTLLDGVDDTLKTTSKTPSDNFFVLGLRQDSTNYDLICSWHIQVDSEDASHIFTIVREDGTWPRKKIAPIYRLRMRKWMWEDTFYEITDYETIVFIFNNEIVDSWTKPS